MFPFKRTQWVEKSIIHSLIVILMLMTVAMAIVAAAGLWSWWKSHHHPHQKMREFHFCRRFSSSLSSCLSISLHSIWNSNSISMKKIVLGLPLCWFIAQREVSIQSNDDTYFLYRYYMVIITSNNGGRSLSCSTPITTDNELKLIHLCKGHPEISRHLSRKIDL